MGQPYFAGTELARRRTAVKAAMQAAGLDLLVVTDPANMDYLTGYKGWSFYVPQCVLVHLEEPQPVWVGRGQDSGAARLTTDLAHERIVSYPDDYVQNRTKHPMNFVADLVRSRGWGRARIALEMDAHYFSGRAADAIRHDLPNARFQDARQLVNWVRIVKSEPELAYMREAAEIVVAAMHTAIAQIEPGTRQCDAVGEIYRTQARGTARFGGDYTAICPLLPTGEGTGTPHLTWSDRKFGTGEATIIEIAGARLNYHAPMARTVHLGKPPAKLADTAEVVVEGLRAALAAARPGRSARRWRPPGAASSRDTASRRRAASATRSASAIRRTGASRPPASGPATGLC